MTLRILRHLFPAMLLISSGLTRADYADRISINENWMFQKPGTAEETTVHLPHSWNSDAYSTHDYYRGPGIYTRTMTAPENFKGKRIFLKFDGAASRSAVSVDGITVGRHVGAYSPHIVDVTDLMSDGSSHKITVTVDNSDRSVPPFSADFTFMGGLYRDAWLMAMPALHFDIAGNAGNPFRVKSGIDRRDCGQVDVTVPLVNDSGSAVDAEITCRVTDHDGTPIAEKRRMLRIGAGESDNVHLDFTGLKDIRLWSPEDPALYRVECVISAGGKRIASEESYTAFREFGFDPEGRFLLNGSPYKLRGMCRHQDQRPMGIALTDEQHRRDMRMIKDLGANFVRISHYPQDDAVLEMCDRLGLIVWEEIPVIDYVPDDGEFADNAATMLRDMIRSHYNHPAIAMWGYMNEILLRVPSEESDATRLRTLRLAERLEKILHEEDPDRLSAMAFHGSDTYHDAGLSDITDVKGWNLYQGWYGGRLEDFETFLSRQHREHPDHKIIVSEYGAGSDPRLHSLHPQAYDFSIEYQQEYLEHYLRVIEDSDFVAGASHWNFIDFSSAGREEATPYINNKGLATNDRRPKDVFHLYRAAWHDPATTPVGYIASRDWQARTEIIDESGCVVRPIKVYSNLPEITLSVNGTALPALRVESGIAVFDTPLHEGPNILRLTDAAGRELDAMTVTVEAIAMRAGRIDPGTAEIAVNVGSDCYFRSDDSGLVWLPDLQYDPERPGYGHTGGRRISSQSMITLTPDIPLLQHALEGILEYRFDVTDGRYEIELLFADLSEPGTGSAYMLGHTDTAGSAADGAMAISAGDLTLEPAFSPLAAAGASRTMVKRRYSATAAGGSGLSISFHRLGDKPTLLSAIKIRKL